MQVEHKQTKSAQRIVWRLENRYSSRMDIVYLFVYNLSVDTRSVHKKAFYTQWLQSHSEQSGLTNSILAGTSLTKDSPVVNPAKVEKEERLNVLREMIQSKGWKETFDNMESTAKILKIATITLYRYKEELSQEHEIA